MKNLRKLLVFSSFLSVHCAKGKYLAFRRFMSSMTFSKIKILIVEDEEALLKMYADAFCKAGFEVMTSSEGMTGIVQAVEKHPDLILLDLFMPQVDGYELLAALKNNSSLKIPVIVLSNMLDAASRDRAIALGAKDYLLKIDHPPQLLIQKVQAYLREAKNSGKTIS